MNAPENVLSTGQEKCYDQAGREVACPGTGQDAEFNKGLAWPKDRFQARGGLVRDRLTGLSWSRDANPAGFPLTWAEALDYADALNRDGHLGHDDWRVPNRRELRSLISFRDKKPALPGGYPFTNIFLGWHWTSTSAAINPAYAWYVHLEGGRMFFGRKTQNYLVWPVRGPGSAVLPVTGQKECFDQEGRIIKNGGRGQDGALQLGVSWPEPRFEVNGETALDRLTGLTWDLRADLAGKPVTWAEAFRLADQANASSLHGRADWRIPNINELESLVDASRYSPALPAGHPFTHAGESYVSSTNSAFEPDWCMALHLHKGAVGVGHKKSGRYLAWLTAG